MPSQPKAALVVSGSSAEPALDPQLEIQPIGDYLETDQAGYLINPCHLDHIQPPWRQVVEAIVEIAKQHLGDQLLSVFVRGSIARGTAVLGVSDIDSYLVVKGNRWGMDLDWIAEAKQQLEQRHTFHGGVEIQSVSDREILDGHLDPSVKFTVKTLSCCVYGEDISLLIPAYKLGVYLAEDIRHFSQTLTQVYSALAEDAIQPQQVIGICRWVMKYLVRAGLYIVLQRDKRYSRDLYPCFAAFIQYYPQHQALMAQALQLAIAPVADQQQIIQVCNRLEAVLSPEIAVIFPQWR